MSERWTFNDGTVVELPLDGFAADDIGKTLYSDDAGNLSLTPGTIIGKIVQVTDSGISVNIPYGAGNGYQVGVILRDVVEE